MTTQTNDRVYAIELTNDSHEVNLEYGSAKNGSKKRLDSINSHCHSERESGIDKKATNEVQ